MRGSKPVRGLIAIVFLAGIFLAGETQAQSVTGGVGGAASSKQEISLRNSTIRWISRQIASSVQRQTWKKIAELRFIELRYDSRTSIVSWHLYAQEEMPAGVSVEVNGQAAAPMNITTDQAWKTKVEQYSLGMINR